MSNYILKYSKGSEVKYISHLDFVRTFTRAVRRSGLAMTYSQGFNPHPVMSVAVPMSVGVTGDGEYLRIGFDEPYTEAEIKQYINNALPIGIEIKDVKKQDEKIKFSDIEMADYEVYIETDLKDLDINKFFSLNEIIISKKSKSGIRDADIKPFLFSLKSEKVNSGYILYMRTAAGNSSLKPDTVIDAMKKYIDGFDCEYYTVHRKSLLTKEGIELL